MTHTTIAVRFLEVGRDKKTWDADVLCVPGTDRPDADALDAALAKGRALMSRDVYCDAPEGGDDRSGTCHAGMHTVGRWEVLTARKEPRP